MPTILPLSKLVDLALGTPEVGAVNFNVLHTLLHAMIGKLNLTDAKAEINDSDRDFLSSSKPQRVLTALSDIDSGKGEDSEDALSEIRDASEIDTPASSATHKSKRPVPYHHLELRVEKLAEQLENLNALPTNADLFERAKAKGDGERPIAEMWQYMQLKKRVDANEDGVGKLMSLVEDLMKEMQTLRDTNAELLDRINNLNIDELKKKLADLEKITNNLNDKFSTLPTPDDYAQFVTWPLLEDALKGVRKEMEGLQASTPTERVVVEIASQTDTKAPSRPPSSRPLSRLSNTSSGPTNDLLDVLERLGKLSDDHEALAKRVEELEEQLKNKVDKSALDNLTQQLADLSEKQQDRQPVIVSAAPPQVEIREVVSRWTQTPPPSPPRPRSPEPVVPVPNLPPPPVMVKSKPETDAKTMPEALHDSKVTPKPEPKLELKPESESEFKPEPKSEPKGEPETKPEPEPESEPEPEPEPEPESEPELDLELQPKREPISEPEPVETTPMTAVTPPVDVPAPLDSDQNEKVLVQLAGPDLSEDLLNQLNKLKEDIDALQGLRDKDNEALSRAQKAILQLQAEVEKLDDTTKHIIAENQHRAKQIESLLTYCDTLEEKKADKEYVAMEVDVKADKRQLDGKVNHSLFDSKTAEINKLIQEILEKLDGSEGSWKDAYRQLAEDVDGKLDRLEIDSLKDWLENRLKALNKKIMANAHTEWGEDDAAGLRKQLLQRFNCLSCDRPVDLMPTGPVPSLPTQNGMPGTRSPRPYTTFELDQIRQHAKSFNNQEIADYYATVRQCGGSHTLTFPHKRVSRMTQMNNLFKDEVEEPREPAAYPMYKEEVDVQGVDGHIYRGRMERVQIEAKMPTKMSGGQSMQTTKTSGQQRTVRTIPYTETERVRATPAPPINSRGRPMSARGTMSPRPGSGRPSSRPQSRPISARLSGQESSRTTPFPDESFNPPDGADQGQATVEAEAIRVDVPTPDINEDPAEE